MSDSLVNTNGFRLPADSDYIISEVQEMTEQLTAERQLVGGSSTKALVKELLTEQVIASALSLWS